MNAIPPSASAMMDVIPSHDALQLTMGGAQARIVLAEQIYTLRITRAGKLILTK
jgi:hemin uptake protein HemP